MKTTVMTIALALGSMALISAQTPAPNTTTAPAPKTAAVKKHHKKAVKKSVKTPAAPAAAAKPVVK